MSLGPTDRRALGDALKSQALADAIADILENSTKATTTYGLGAAAGTNVVATEYGNGVIHQTLLTLTAMPITLTDEAGVGQYGYVKVYDMPAGNITVLGATMDADITLTEAAWLDTAEGDIGIGTTAVTDGNTLSGTE